MKIKVFTGQDRAYHNELIWKNLVNLFNKKQGLTIKSFIKSQKKFIHNLNLNGKNKYKTIEIIKNYYNNPNKYLAEQIFWNTINNKFNLFT